MNINASALVRRARFFLAELRRSSFPNATSIQRFDGCSKATATRVIERLQSEFNFPIAFNSSTRGYYLTDSAFTFEFLPPGRDELCALFLLSQLADTTGDDGVRSAVDSLWQSVAAGNRVLQHDIRTLERVFSADLTAVATLADTGVLDLVRAAAARNHVTVEYKSPWRHSEPKKYAGIFERVHLSDGAVYVMFQREDGRRLVLNASFIRNLTLLKEPLVLQTPLETDIDLAWLDGFGIWASDEIHTVTIRIIPPAAEYYATQRWHYDQTDTWQDGVLSRSFPSMLSPELVRRILSLGRYVDGIEPEQLSNMVTDEARTLLSRFAEYGTSVTS